MLSISQPLSAGQARTYHAREFASSEQNYWSRDQQGHSEWQGRLAGEWGLAGAVGAEHFARLSEGQHPQTEAQLVRHQTAKTYDGKFGREVTSVEHRAGWDATFSAPKSVSLTALVGGDDRVRVAHRESVRAALSELERYTQARIGNIRAPETTGKFAAATFEHDTARPVEGYAAPQLHTHAVIFNVTETGERPDPRPPAPGAFRLAELCHECLPIGAGRPAQGSGIHDRARRVWPARNQGIHERVHGGQQPTPGTGEGPPTRQRA